MSFGLLLPAALAALTALLLPLAIHLARRSEQRPTPFAALRWLRHKPRPRHRIRFDEWPLLLVRLLLLALLALWLARPLLFGERAETSWVAVAPGIDPAQVGEAVDDARRELHWLAPGFPSLSQPAPQDPLPLASLLRQLDAELPAAAALTVYVPERLDGADGGLPLLSRAVDWRVLPGAMPVRETPTDAPPALVVRHAGDRAPALRYLHAAAQAWQPADDESDADADADTATDIGDLVDTASATVPLPADAQYLVWLVPGPLPDTVRHWMEAGGVALLDSDVELEPESALQALWRDADGAPLVEGGAFGRGRMLRLTRPLLPASMPQLLEPDFPQRLRALLEPPPAPARVYAADYAPETGGAAYPQPPRDLQPWWALLIALVLLVERWLATARRRGSAP
ncbi:BatA domain-containing protein [Luteimonas salinilitoris]|uniref:BatA domain-containing protein n=1 Tax=Luteimonas salinilitoris TaxID=3237697 RepID=A0ABV4HQN5_9GAMM